MYIIIEFKGRQGWDTYQYTHRGYNWRAVDETLRDALVAFELVHPGGRKITTIRINL